MNVISVALEEFRVNIRTKQCWMVTMLFAVISLGMAYYLKSTRISEELYKTLFQMLFLSSFSHAFNYSVALLGILLGATAINREIEKGTLKSMVQESVSRGKIITGKLIGGLLTIVVALALFYILTVAFALILGVSMTRDDLVRFLATIPFSMLYGLVFLSFGLLISTLIKKSKNALMMAIIVFIFFSFLIPTIAGIVAFAVAGLPPSPNIPGNATNLTQSQLQEIIIKDPAYQAWLTKLTTTAEKILYISPNYHYQEIIRIIFGAKPQISAIVSSISYNRSVVENRPIVESLGLVWKNVLALLAMFIISFAMAYARFMKLIRDGSNVGTKTFTNESAEG